MFLADIYFCRVFMSCFSGLVSKREIIAFHFHSSLIGDGKH